MTTPRTQLPGAGVTPIFSLPPVPAMPLPMLFVADAPIEHDMKVDDTLALSDEVAVLFEKVIADTLALSDFIEAGKAASVDDTLALSDAVRLDVTMTLAEALALADALAVEFQKVVGDTLAITDAISSASIGFNVTIADTLGGGGGATSQALIYLTESGRWAVRVASTGKVYMEL